MANEIKSVSFFSICQNEAGFNYISGFILISLQNDLFKLGWAKMILL